LVKETCEEGASRAVESVVVLSDGGAEGCRSSRYYTRIGNLWGCSRGANTNFFISPIGFLPLDTLCGVVLPFNTLPFKALEIEFEM